MEERRTRNEGHVDGAAGLHAGGFEAAHSLDVLDAHALHVLRAAAKDLALLVLVRAKRRVDPVLLRAPRVSRPAAFGTEQSQRAN